MINLILQEGRRYLESDAHNNALNAIASQFTLTEDELGYFAFAVHGVILGTIPEESFTKELKNLSDIRKDKIEKLYNAAKERIFIPYRKHLSNMLQNTPTPIPRPKNADEVVGISTLRQAPVAPQAPVAAPTPTYVPTVPRSQPHPQVQAPIQQPAPQQPPRPAAPESLSKQDIVSAIENPPRTVIKKYVLEHEAITDPGHLIDDTVDERPRLEA